MMGLLKNFLNKIPFFKKFVDLYDVLLSVSECNQWVIHNVKQMAVELAKQQKNPKITFAGQFGDCPRKVELRSGICIQKEMESIEYAYWMDQLGIDFFYHRKFWEWAYITQAIWQGGFLAEGKRGLGFAVGTEHLPSYFASKGATIHATDAPSHLSVGWFNTSQYASGLESIYKPNLLSRETFNARVAFEAVDMNQIPDRLRDFDFCWSSCSLEHLGGLEQGLDFIVNSLKTLKSGGWAVHTTEYTVSSNDKTLESGPTVLYRKQDMEKVAEHLTKIGHEVMPLDFSYGDMPLDHYIDLPPSGLISPHLKLAFRGYACTSFGLIVKKK